MYILQLLENKLFTVTLFSIKAIFEYFIPDCYRDDLYLLLFSLFLSEASSNLSCLFSSAFNDLISHKSFGISYYDVKRF